MEKKKVERPQKVFQSRDITGRVEGMVGDSPPTKGLVSGAEIMLDAGQWLMRNALPAEMVMFRGIVQARLSKVAAAGMRRLPNGVSIPASNVLAICGQCDQQSWTSPEHADGGICVFCGKNPATGGPGKLRRATPKEVKTWTAKATAAHAKYLADALKRAKDLADFNKRRREDAGKD